MLSFLADNEGKTPQEKVVAKRQKCCQLYKPMADVVAALFIFDIQSLHTTPSGHCSPLSSYFIAQSFIWRVKKKTR